MNYCKLCGSMLLDTHYAMHGLTKEQYESKYGTDKFNAFNGFRIRPRVEVSECEKRDAERKFKKKAY